MSNENKEADRERSTRNNPHPIISKKLFEKDGRNATGMCMLSVQLRSLLQNVTNGKANGNKFWFLLEKLTMSG